MNEFVSMSATTVSRFHLPIWRRLIDAWQQSRAEARTRRALESLDDRMLKDIGISRYEIDGCLPPRHLDFWPWGRR